MAKLDLGGLGKTPAEPIEEDTFEWYGSTVRVGAEATDLALIDFVELAGDMDENDPQSGVFVKRFIRDMIHEDDFPAFWDLARKNRLGFQELAEVAHTIIEQVTNRPTVQSSDSSAGLHAIALNSTAASYSEVRGELEAEGRWDLALVYDDAERAGVAS